jgi:hypothetical protein
VTPCSSNESTSFSSGDPTFDLMPVLHLAFFCSLPHNVIDVGKSGMFPEPSSLLVLFETVHAEFRSSPKGLQMLPCNGRQIDV